MNWGMFLVVVVVVVVALLFGRGVYRFGRQWDAPEARRRRERDEGCAALLALDAGRGRGSGRLDRLDRARVWGYAAVWVGAAVGALLAARVVRGRG